MVNDDDDEYEENVPDTSEGVDDEEDLLETDNYLDQLPKGFTRTIAGWLDKRFQDVIKAQVTQAEKVKNLNTELNALAKKVSEIEIRRQSDMENIESMISDKIDKKFKDYENEQLRKQIEELKAKNSD